jgi:ABC-2 type transport system permease protein
MWRRIWAVVQKELVQTLRDRRTLALYVSFPIFQLFLFGYAISTSVEDIPTAVADHSLDWMSQGYVDAMEASGFFDIVLYAQSEGEIIAAIDRGDVSAGVVIPPAFAARVEQGDAQALVLVDGSDVFTSQSAYNAATAIAQNYSMEIVLSRVEEAGRPLNDGRLLPLDGRARILYNPNLDDLWFVIPGMLAMLIQVQSITLTAMAVVREREVGTIEQLLVTPIRPVELMIGKMAPPVLIALVNLLTILGLGVYWFRVPFQGDFWLFLALAFMYILSGLGLGLLVSTIAQNQRQSLQLISLFNMVGLVLGGFIFPRYTMPAAVRVVGNLFPLTYFITISRGIVTKGVGLAVLWEDVAALSIHIVLILFVATRAFREDLE